MSVPIHLFHWTMTVFLCFHRFSLDDDDDNGVCVDDDEYDVDDDDDDEVFIQMYYQRFIIAYYYNFIEQGYSWFTSWIAVKYAHVMMLCVSPPQLYFQNFLTPNFLSMLITYVKSNEHKFDLIITVTHWSLFVTSYDKISSSIFQTHQDSVFEDGLKALFFFNPRPHYHWYTVPLPWRATAVVKLTCCGNGIGRFLGIQQAGFVINI